MKRLFLPILVVFVFFMMVFLGDERLARLSGSTELDVITLRAAQSKAWNHPVSQGIDKFAELVEEKSDGEIIIETYHDGLIGDDRK